MCHRAEYGPRFFVFRAEKASEVLRVDPKKLNSYVGVVNQPPPKWSIKRMAGIPAGTVPTWEPSYMLGAG